MVKANMAIAAAAARTVMVMVAATAELEDVAACNDLPSLASICGGTEIHTIRIGEIDQPRKRIRPIGLAPTLSISSFRPSRVAARAGIHNQGTMRVGINLPNRVLRFLTTS